MSKQVLDYLQKYNSIKGLSKDIKIYVLSNFTINPIKQFLEVELYNNKVNAEILLGGYDQYYQEVFDEKSKLYSSEPQAIVLALDFMKLFPEIEDNFHALSFDSKNNLIQDRLNLFKSIIQQLRKKTNALILINNFYLRKAVKDGILDVKSELGIKEFILKFNLEAIQLCKNEINVFLVDSDKVVANGGVESFDRKMEFMADLLLSNQALLNLSKEYARYIKSMKGIIKKCLIFDLDNTLWGGVIGEDGINGISLGTSYPGNTFLEFQKAILNLYNKGFILAINSKNNFEDAIEVFRKHPNMVLKEEHFSILKINWQDKATNMREIVHELNIGLDSLVFFDDNPSERALIKQELPEVLVVNLSEDSSTYRDSLENLFAFDLLKITEEDKKRNQMYSQQKKRKELETSSNSMEEFLTNLEIKVNISDCDSFSLSRVTQMINKTNQFNLTTKRYDGSQMQTFFENQNYKIYIVKVKDKFGDYGITALAIIKKEEEVWIIDSFLLSCRVIGKTIEKALLQQIIEDAKKENVKILKGKFIPTEKNKPCSTFYQENGFSKFEKDNIWDFDLSQVVNLWPRWIKNNDFY